MRNENEQPEGGSRSGLFGKIKKIIKVDSKPKRARTTHETGIDPSKHHDNSTGASTLGGGDGGLINPKTWTVTNAHRSEDDTVAGAANPDLLRADTASWRDTRGYDVAGEITKVMMRNKIGLTGQYDWLPDEERERLITTDNVRKTLGYVPEKFADWIKEKASKMFVITVLAISERETRLAAMTDFSRNDFGDDNLPVKDLPTICGHDWDASDRLASVAECGQHGPKEGESVDEGNVHCLYHAVWSSWNTTTFKTFYEKQWRLLLQRFDHKDANGNRVFEYSDIEHDRILPILPSGAGIDKKAFRGNFGTVVPARMLQSFIEERASQTTVDIAIKTLTEQNDKTYVIDKEWHSEVAAHKELGELDRKHLVRAIAAYRHRGEYCLLFEWADGGNLRSYWESTDHTGLSSDMIREYLTELLGLSRALNKMHNTTRSRSRSPSDLSRNSTISRSRSSTRSSGHGPVIVLPDAERPLTPQNVNIEETTEPLQRPQVPFQLSLQPPQDNVQNFETQQGSPTQENENWRHGDIKPDNILRFTQERSALGTLKLADLGRAKRRSQATKFLPVIEQDNWRTKAYEPPDLYIRRNKSMSRLFDIWSLGCVFFESVVWMLYGKQWLQNFAHTTTSANENETPFWVRRQDPGSAPASATLSPIIEVSMKHIFSKDPECNGLSPSALGDLLTLVRTKMLVIDLPEDTDTYTPGKRANTQTIFDDLQEIVRKANEQPNYLFTGKDRTGLDHPPEPKKGIPSIGPESTSQSKPQTSLEVPGQSQTPLNTYSVFLDRKWRYRNDYSFARSVYEPDSELYDAECLELNDQDPEVCNPCRLLDFNSNGVLLNRQMQEFDTGCCICNMMSFHARTAGLTETEYVSLSKHETGLAMRHVRTLNHIARWRLCRSIGGNVAVNENKLTIPPGLLKLPNNKSTASFSLLRAWLQDCNNGHGERKLDCVSVPVQKPYPKRLLHVGIGESAKLCVSKIIETSSLPEKSRRDLRYLALSHPWGDNTADNPHFTSTTDNIERHMNVGILDSELPPNFRDAVYVTRQLGVRYLWIDALCIKQASPSGDPGDFQEEAKSMQNIFTSAYCVLAASSATGMNSGFLHSGDRTPKKERQAVNVNCSGVYDSVYMCDSPDDFQNDVIHGSLSSRAWAFQERALARRTIFFTDNQIYWECSGGVRCESMSRMENSEAASLGDSNFPAYFVRNQTKGAQILLFKSLYTLYCGLTIRRRTDKPFAISALEQRLTQTFKDWSGAGVFGKHKHRCLLWKKADKVERLERIDFPTPAPETQNPPSWSFMAYIGRIEYIDVPGRSTKWANLDLQLTGSSKASWINEGPLTFRGHACNFETEQHTIGISWLIEYDDPSMIKTGNERCVVLGTSDVYHYVLVVRPKHDGKSGASGAQYERCGAGYVPTEWVKKDRCTAVDIV